MSTTINHWLVSAPSAWNSLKGTENMSTNTLLNIPKLRSGTLDSLMTLSDDLQKHDAQIEGVVRKFERQMVDFGVTQFTVPMNRDPTKPSGQGQRTEVATDLFVANFEWANNKYQEKLPLAEINSKIYQEVMKADEDLRVKQTEYNTVKSQLQSLQRKQTGSLAVRSLASLKLDKKDFIDTENLSTVLVVVPKMDEKQWFSTYATHFLEKETNLGFFPVLINSSKKVYDDSENVLLTVTVFKRKLQDFKTAVREKQPRWTVREYTAGDESNNEEAESQKLIAEHEAKAKRTLKQFCTAMYGEVFRAYIHLKAVRLFVESCLRYGVPPEFDLVIMKVNPRYEKKLRDELQRRFGGRTAASMYSSAGEDIPVGISGASDFYPYVYLPLSVSVPPQSKA